jgi:hypothetical protein
VRRRRCRDCSGGRGCQGPRITKTGQLLQDFGAGFGVAGTGGSIRHEQRVRNEITGEDGEIGFERETHSALDLGLAHIRAKVQITEDGDTKSMKGFRQIFM